MPQPHTATRAKIDVQLPKHATAKQHRDLGVFARFCVLRVERELGEHESWLVRVETSASTEGYETSVTVRDGGTVLEARGTGQDSALAMWDAMCRLEQALRERRTA